MDGVLQEPFTGTTDERPVYQEALRYIRKNRGTIRYFVVMTIDRFSREGAFKYQQMKAELAAEGVELRDISGVIQPRVNSLQHLGFKYGWSETSPSDVGEVVLAETASHERSRILTRLVEAQIRLTQGGYHLGPANDGYVVKRVFVDGKKKRAQFPDPERAEFVRVMFRMRAEGTTSDEEIVKHLNGLGFRTKPFNRWNRAKTVVVGHKPGMPLTVKHFQCLIQRPAYCGITVRRWTHGKAVRARGGEALIQSHSSTLPTVEGCSSKNTRMAPCASPITTCRAGNLPNGTSSRYAGRSRMSLRAHAAENHSSQVRVVANLGTTSPPITARGDTRDTVYRKPSLSRLSRPSWRHCTSSRSSSPVLKRCSSMPFTTPKRSGRTRGGQVHQRSPRSKSARPNWLWPLPRPHRRAFERCSTNR